MYTQRVRACWTCELYESCPNKFCVTDVCSHYKEDVGEVKTYRKHLLDACRSELNEDYAIKGRI